MMTVSVGSGTTPPGQGAVGLLNWLDRKALPADTPPPSQHWSIAIVKEKLKQAKILDPYNDGWMPAALEDWQRYIENTPAEVRAQYGSLVWTLGMTGPLSAVGTLLSYPDVFRLLYEDHEFLTELLEFHTQNVTLWVKAVEQVRLRRVLTLWVLVYMFLGTQMAWSLRPFVGAPGQPFVILRHSEGGFYSSVYNLLIRLLGF